MKPIVDLQLHTYIFYINYFATNRLFQALQPIANERGKKTNTATEKPRICICRHLFTCYTQEYAFECMVQILAHILQKPCKIGMKLACLFDKFKTSTLGKSCITLMILSLRLYSLWINIFVRRFSFIRRDHYNQIRFGLTYLLLAQCFIIYLVTCKNNISFASGNGNKYNFILFYIVSVMIQSCKDSSGFCSNGCLIAESLKEADRRREKSLEKKFCLF